MFVPALIVVGADVETRKIAIQSSLELNHHVKLGVGFNFGAQAENDEIPEEKKEELANYYFAKKGSAKHRAQQERRFFDKTI